MRVFSSIFQDIGRCLPPRQSDSLCAGPAVYVAKGTVTEHNSQCAVPIVHTAGSVTEEFGVGCSHWWENTGNEVVKFLSADVLPYNSDAATYVGFEP